MHKGEIILDLLHDLRGFQLASKSNIYNIAWLIICEGYTGANSYAAPKTENILWDSQARASEHCPPRHVHEQWKEQDDTIVHPKKQTLS